MNRHFLNPLLAVFLIGVVNADEPVQTNPADQLFRAYWEYNLSSSPTTASYLGDLRFNDRWPNATPQAQDEHVSKLREFVSKANGIDQTKLAPNERLNLDLFKRELKWMIDDHPYGWHLLPIQQREGIQTAHELADALPFTTVKHYEDWIKRLETYPVFMDQTIETLTMGVERKMVHPKLIIERVAGQLKKLASDEADSSPFYRPFKRFPESISAADRSKLADRGRAAITNHVLPALNKLKTFVDKTYLPAGYDRVGCWQVPNGKDMYAFRSRRFTTTNLTPEQIHKLGLSEVARIRKQMEEIKTKVGFQGTLKEFFQELRTNPKFYYKTPDELFDAYLALSKRIDPTLVKVFKTIPRMPYGCEPIPMQTAPDTTTAYYREPAADGSRAGSFFVNLYQPASRPKYEMEALSLHEAVPGHHFQIALAMELGELPAFRRYGGYTSFIEGWALYAESLGDELGFYKDPYSKFGQLTYEMWRAVRLVVDTGMHDLGWSREQAVDFFKDNAAKSELDINNEIDRYIAWPGQALAYKVGELKIKELRARATTELGNQFNLKEFHDVVLLQGAIPLDLLEENVTNWIAKVKSAK